MNFEHPERIGKYEILSVLGQGGMGIVYRGLDKRMGREVAIKTVTEDFGRDSTMLERFYQEAEKTGRMSHPNIVTIYELGEQDGNPYIVMELVDGQPLDKIIRENRALPLLDKIRIIEHVCAALGYAHRHDVIHRDVKPANVIVQRDGTAKLLDFGIAREENRTGQALTRTGIVVGTVPYMAPERLRGGALDARSDIFAAGVLLFQTLTGQLPFQGEDAQLASKIFHEKHPLLSLYLPAYPPVLDAILDRSLAKNPNDRYATADEMSTELCSLIDEMKSEHIAAVLQQVKRLTADQNFVQARDTLLQLLKLDNQHVEAKRLLADVQQHLLKKHRQEQAQQLTLRAEDLVREKDFKKAIDLLDQASRLVPDDTEVVDLLAHTRKKKSDHDKIEDFLHQADTARNAGDISTARAIVEQARELDALDSRVHSIYLSLSRHEEEAAERAQARGLMERAQAEMAARRFAAAAQLLREAVAIDPLNQQLQALLSSAVNRDQQDQRRALLDEVANEVARAATPDQIQTAQASIQAAIKKIGADPVLLRLQAQITKQTRELDAKRLVEETARECRAILETSPADALALVDATLDRLPTNEHLLALRAEIELRLTQVEREQRQAQFLGDAHKAVADGRFADAVAVLEGCDLNLQSREISELLEFARNEARQEEHRNFVASTLTRGQQLIRDGRYKEATAFLKPILSEEDEPGLRTLLKQAETLHSTLLERVAAAEQQARTLLQIEAWDQALTFLQALPADVQSESALQRAMEQAREAADREHKLLSLLGQRYAQLAQQPPPAGWPKIDTAPGVLAQMALALDTRRKALTR